jgi:transposase-like protein
MIVQLVLEAERTGNAAAICKREGIASTLLYRWRQKVKEGAVASIQAMKRGPKKQDPVKAELETENSRSIGCRTTDMPTAGCGQLP